MPRPHPRSRTALVAIPGVLAAAALLAVPFLAVGGQTNPQAGAPGVQPVNHGLRVWPNPVRSGRPAVIETADRRARTGALVECLIPPGGRSRCATAARVSSVGTRGGSSAGQAAFALRAGVLGRWRVELRAAGHRPLPSGSLDITRTIRVAPGPVRLLATGDSEIQGIDNLLASGLPAVRVTSEAHISTGISKPQMFDWVGRAASQAATAHPDITAVYIGANDGFALPTASGRLVNCCGPDWIAAFARRTRSMMASYLRGGAGRVYWFTLPAPRDSATAGVFRAINRAYEQAAASFPVGVRLLDIRPIFTPGGRYRERIDYGGRFVNVRLPDGYHLSDGGNRIATADLIGAIRADGLIG